MEQNRRDFLKIFGTGIVSLIAFPEMIFSVDHPNSEKTKKIDDLVFRVLGLVKKNYDTVKGYVIIKGREYERWQITDEYTRNVNVEDGAVNFRYIEDKFLDLGPQIPDAINTVPYNLSPIPEIPRPPILSPLVPIPGEREFKTSKKFNNKSKIIIIDKPCQKCELIWWGFNNDDKVILVNKKGTQVINTQKAGKEEVAQLESQYITILSDVLKTGKLEGPGKHINLGTKIIYKK